MADPVNEEYRRIGQRIRLAREEARLTQRELGDQIGVSDSTVTQWEKGTRAISIEDAKLVARVLHVTILDIIGNGESVEDGSSLSNGDHTINALDRDHRIHPTVREHMKEMIRREHERYRRES